jgi:hypothetical protein
VEREIEVKREERRYGKGGRGRQKGRERETEREGEGREREREREGEETLGGRGTASSVLCTPGEGPLPLSFAPLATPLPNN